MSSSPNRVRGLQKLLESLPEPWRSWAAPAGKMALGALLMGAGARRRGVMGAAMTATGGVVINRAAHQLAQLLEGHMAHRARGPGAQPPEGTDERRQRYGQSNGEERDLVDEASWESFPASDPPAYNR